MNILPLSSQKKKVPQEEHGARLDDFLVRAFHITRSQSKKAILESRVLVNEVPPKKAGIVLSSGDDITFFSPHVSSGLLPSHEPVNILFENESVIVVEKPVGIVTHPDATHTKDTLLQRVLAHTSLAEKGLPLRPGVVHRLDKETSGVLVFAKTDSALLVLQKSFAKRKVQKIYRTLIHGAHIAEKGTIASPIARDVRDRKKMSVSAGGEAKHALSHFTVVQRFQHVSELLVQIETGRTHQIRVHLSAIGSPVLGDAVYGSRKQDEEVSRTIGCAIPRCLLHAESLSLVLPNEQEEMTFISPIPSDFSEVLFALSAKK
ncbi:RluA family pseudouridine synthase [Candidatus Peregrinibacteria bacterium]|nr:MAG: RluA family pseudouridine synthase [Candidatus Peregrinibacteria bacterium]